MTLNLDIIGAGSPAAAAAAAGSADTLGIGTLTLGAGSTSAGAEMAAFMIAFAPEILLGAVVLVAVAAVYVYLLPEGDPLSLIQSQASSPNKMNQEVKKGQAPDGVTHVDDAHVPGDQPHIHFDDDTSQNQDGTPHHGDPSPTRAQERWLIKHGWTP